jgi:hypothetical protein
MDAPELLWRQYSQNVGLFKFYMDLVVKFNVFYYAVTGAILLFFFANPDTEDAKYALLLPIIMSVAFAFFFIYGAVLARVLRDDVFAIRDNLGLRAAPDVGVLSVLLYIFASVFIVVAAGCTYLVWFR